MLGLCTSSDNYNSTLCNMQANRINTIKKKVKQLQ